MYIYIGFKTKEEADNLLSEIESGEKEIPRTGYTNIPLLVNDLGNNCSILKIELSNDARLDHEVPSENSGTILTYRKSDILSISNML